MRRKRLRFLIHTVLLALGVSAFWWGPLVYRSVRYWPTVNGVWPASEVDRDGRVRWVVSVSIRDRFDEDRVVGSRGYFVDSGFLRHERELDPPALTLYAPDGTIESQWVEEKPVGPPWRWGKGDQRSPSLPDWLRDEALEELASREETSGEAPR